MLYHFSLALFAICLKECIPSIYDCLKGRNIYCEVNVNNRDPDKYGSDWRLSLCFAPSTFLVASLPSIFDLLLFNSDIVIISVYISDSHS
jgi:hypothetical protein